MSFQLSKVLGPEKATRFFFYIHNVIQVFLSIFCMAKNHRHVEHIVIGIILLLKNYFVIQIISRIKTFCHIYFSIVQFKTYRLIILRCD